MTHDFSSFEEQIHSQYGMPDDIFEAIVKIAKQEAGLIIHKKKRALVQSRVSKRLRAFNCPDYYAYLREIVDNKNKNEMQEFISALTTNVSSFFRERHHFEHLAVSVLPKLLDRLHSGEEIRIWSAGCSSGQEAYSIAMQCIAADQAVSRLNLKILGTDIDKNILLAAKQAIYDKDQLKDIPKQFREYVEYSETTNGTLRVRDCVRQLVTFRHLNLLRQWPMTRRFDAIFCRNVVIYFDETTQLELWPRFRASLKDTGQIYLGHSERIPDPESLKLKPSGVTAYSAA